MPEVSGGTDKEPSGAGVIFWISNITVPRTSVGDPQSGDGMNIVGITGVSVEGASAWKILPRNRNITSATRTTIPTPIRIPTIKTMFFCDEFYPFLGSWFMISFPYHYYINHLLLK